LKYQPTGNGNVQAALQIVSNDSAGARVIRLNGTGVAASGSLWPIIAVLLGVAVIAGGAVAYEELK
jgi:hypothetical protein